MEISFESKGKARKGDLTGIDEKTFIEKVGKQYLDNIKQKLERASLSPSLGSARRAGEVVAVDPRYFRPTEVELLKGDATKAREKLGWKLKYNLDTLIQDMVQSDIQLMQKDAYLREGGFRTMNYFE